MTLSRRHVLSVAVAAVVAGCLADSDAPQSIAGYIDDGVLDYVDFVDGAADISTNRPTTVIEYTDPERRFEAVAGYRDEQTNGEQMRVSTDLSTDVPTAFPAPVYDSDAERFFIHVFANEAFVSFGDWEAWIGSASDPDRVDDIRFEELTDGVQHTVVDPEGTLEVAIIVDPETKPSGVVVGATNDDLHSSVPLASFEFDSNGEVVTITHGGGDHISADRLSITVGDERVDATFDDDPVTVGSTVQLNKSLVGNRTVRIIWENAGENYSATLADWTPDSN